MSYFYKWSTPVGALGVVPGIRGWHIAFDGESFGCYVSAQAAVDDLVNPCSQWPSLPQSTRSRLALDVAEWTRLPFTVRQ